MSRGHGSQMPMDYVASQWVRSEQEASYAALSAQDMLITTLSRQHRKTADGTKTYANGFDHLALPEVVNFIRLSTTTLHDPAPNKATLEEMEKLWIFGRETPTTLPMEIVE